MTRLAVWYRRRVVRVWVWLSHRKWVVRSVDRRIARAYDRLVDAEERLP